MGAVPGRLFESTNKTIHHLSTLGVGTGARAQYQNHKKLGNWMTFEKVMQSANAMTKFKVLWRTWTRDNFLFSIRTLTSSSEMPNAGIARILSANLTRQCSFNIIMWIFFLATFSFVSPLTRFKWLDFLVMTCGQKKQFANLLSNLIFLHYIDNLMLNLVICFHPRPSPAPVSFTRTHTCDLYPRHLDILYAWATCVHITRSYLLY